jgi:MFS family permease
MTLKKIRQTYNSQIVSEFVSTLGDTLFFPVFIAFAMTFKVNTLFLTLITVSEYLPYILSPFMGTFVDRKKEKLSIVYAAAIFQTALYALLAFFLGSNGTSVALMFTMIVINFITGCLNKINNSAVMTLVLNIIEDEDELKIYRTKAVGANTVVIIAGQLLGALLLTKFGAQLLSIINAVTFLIPMLIIVALKKNYMYSQNLLAQKLELLGKTSFIDTFKEIVSNKVIAKLMIFIGGANFALIPLASMFIPKLLASFDSLPIDNLTICYGLAVLTFGIFTVIGVLCTQKIKFESSKILDYLLILSAVVGAIYGIMFFARNFYVLLALAGLFGLTLGIFNVFSETYFYSIIPVEKTAIYNGIMQAVTMGTGVLSTIIAAPIIKNMGINCTFLIYSILLISMVIIGRVANISKMD